MTSSERPEWECRAEVSIRGFECPPDEISRALGVPPSRTWLRGDKVGPTIMLRDSNGWQLCSAKSAEVEPEQHVLQLLHQLPDDITHLLRQVSPVFRVEVSCVLYLRGGTPPLGFAAATLRRIADMNANLDLDIILLPAESEEQHT
jgi:hypothetical protein